MTTPNIPSLIALAEKWEQTARNKFISADHQVDDPTNMPTAKRFVAHGAICYFNCAQELRRFLSSLESSSLDNQGECQK